MMMESSNQTDSEYTEDVEDGHDNEMTMSPMETTSGSFSDGGAGGEAQFSEDASGTRVMRDTNDPTASFVRVRRWRKLVLAVTIFLVVVVVVAFALGRRSALASPAFGEHGLFGSKNEQSTWKLVGETLVQPDTLIAMENHEFVNYGSKVKMDRENNRMAVAKQGLNRIGGGVDVWSHWSQGHGGQYHPNEWFLEASLSLPPPQGGVTHSDMAMDMSQDGHRLVFNQGNTIHVYWLEGLNDFEWDAFGKPIELPSNHDSGTTVYGHEIAMSGDGFFVAVLGFSTTSSEPAFVDIFHYKTTRNGSEFIDEWLFVKEIQLQTLKGGSMAFDTFGKRLVIGETAGESTSRITVYDRPTDDLSQWIERLDPLQAISLPQGDFGHVVSLSGDGTRLAIGTEEGKGNFFAVMEAKQDGQEVKWVPMGKAHQTTATHRRLGASVALSFDGTRLAVGAPGNPDLGGMGDSSLKQYIYGEIHLYEYSEKKGEWVEVLAPKRSVEAGDALGSSVTIDNSGQIVAAGAPRRNSYQGRGFGAAVAYSIQE